MEPTAQGKDILTVKMETRHPVGQTIPRGSFGSEFSASVIIAVIAAWSRKTWKFCEQFLRFFGKNKPLT